MILYFESVIVLLPAGIVDNADTLGLKFLIFLVELVPPIVELVPTIVELVAPMVELVPLGGATTMNIVVSNRT